MARSFDMCGIDACQGRAIVSMVILVPVPKLQSDSRDHGASTKNSVRPLGQGLPWVRHV